MDHQETVWSPAGMLTISTFAASIGLAAALTVSGCSSSVVDSNNTATESDCAPGAACACTGSGACKRTCTGVGCAVSCAGPGACNIVCAQGSCVVSNNGAGSAHISCAGGKCTLDCNSSGSCYIDDCAGGNCACNVKGSGSCI